MTPLEQLRRAIADEGPSPSMHRRVAARHRAEWPTLWAAIDRILESRTPGDLLHGRVEPTIAATPLEPPAQPRHWRIVEAPDGRAPSIVRVNPPEDFEPAPEMCEADFEDRRNAPEEP